MVATCSCYTSEHGGNISRRMQTARNQTPRFCFNSTQHPAPVPVLRCLQRGQARTASVQILAWNNFGPAGFSSNHLFAPARLNMAPWFKCRPCPTRRGHRGGRATDNNTQHCFHTLSCDTLQFTIYEEGIGGGQGQTPIYSRTSLSPINQFEYNPRPDPLWAHSSPMLYGR